MTDTQKLCGRVRELDRLYLAADAASWAWIKCNGPEEEIDRLRQIAGRKWDECRALRGVYEETKP
jgi:hypothetical protein